MVGRIVRVLAVLVILASAVLATRIAYVGYGPGAGDRVVPDQVRFLQRAVARGDGARMQQLFPEGSFFLTALTTSAASGVSDPGSVRALRDELDSPASVAVFGSGMQPEHGIFQAGWSLSAAVDLATASQDPTDRADVDRRAAAVDAAFRSSTTGFLAAYPGQFWPCDSVVGAAALARAAVLLDRPEWLETVRRWRQTVMSAADPASGLLSHRVDDDGRALEAPRGSSQSIIQTFWPAISQALDGHPDTATWSRFVDTFVVREAGLVGVREYPRGQPGAGDVDSGPLILGVSASASVVTLAAARAVGDDRLASSLDREAELFGLPLAWPGGRRYVFGVLPVGDAFLAWARSRSVVGPPIAGNGPGAPWWPAMIALALLPGLLCFLVGWGFGWWRLTRPRAL